MAKITGGSELQDQHEIIARLAAMNLPVGSPEEMEQEIVLGQLGVKKVETDHVA